MNTVHAEGRKFDTRQLVLIGLFAALVFVGSKIEIRFPTVLGVSRFHLGNAMCLLAGLTIGAAPGGFAAGFGSFIFDVVFWGGNPAGWLVTFVTKFLMGFVAGLCWQRQIFRSVPQTANLVLCGVLGQLAYIAGYLLKEFITARFILEQQMSVVSLMLLEKGLSSAVNAVIAVVLSVVLFSVLQPALRRSGLIYERSV